MSTMTRTKRAKPKASDFLMIGVEDIDEPNFSVSEVAKFFARSTHWVRWRERKGFFFIDGNPAHQHDEYEEEWETDEETGEVYCSCGALRVGNRRTEEGYRLYRLDDIELMAHGLAQKGVLDGQDLAKVVDVVRAYATVWGHLEPEEPEEDG